MNEIIKNKFIDFINEGENAASKIIEADKKGMLYAALAQAIADSHLIGVSISEPSTEVNGKDSLKPESNKGNKKTGKAGNKKTSEVAPVETPESPANEVPETPEAPIAPAVETPEWLTEVQSELPKTEAPVAEEKQEAPITEEVKVEAEWTEEMLALKQVEIDLLNSYITSWEMDFIVTKCMTAYFEDSTITEDKLWDYIRPTNIDGFITYLESLSQ